MELFLLLVAILTIGDPEWLGRHLAKARVWSDYYYNQEKVSLRRAVAKARLTRIRKTYPDAFKPRK